MLVKTLYPHSNAFGAAFAKAQGDEYDLPEESAPALIAANLVEALPAPASDEPGDVPEIVEISPRRRRAAPADLSPDLDEVPTAQTDDGAAGQG